MWMAHVERRLDKGCWGGMWYHTQHRRMRERTFNRLIWRWREVRGEWEGENQLSIVVQSLFASILCDSLLKPRQSSASSRRWNVCKSKEAILQPINLVLFHFHQPRSPSASFHERLLLTQRVIQLDNILRYTPYRPKCLLQLSTRHAIHNRFDVYMIYNCYAVILRFSNLRVKLETNAMC